VQLVLDDRAAEGRTVLADGISGESRIVAVSGEALALKVVKLPCRTSKGAALKTKSGIASMDSGFALD